MNRVLRLLLIVVALLVTVSLLWNPQNAAAAPDAGFGDYWYQGKAELNRYQLEQERYGEIREGDAVLIFVTEDFLSDKQVKYESGPRTDAVVSTLKLNMTRKFWTGIYPYSIMTSVFTPVEYQQMGTLKVTGSTQEWCGHAFTQLNRKSSGDYDFRQFSYFQREGDQQNTIKNAIPEDGVWTQLRLNPQALPVGEVNFIPALHFIRLRHKAGQGYKATATLSSIEEANIAEGELLAYEIEYQDLPRRLKIVADAQFPHVVRYWEEVSSENGLVTRAKLTHQVLNNYWSLNGEEDGHLRSELGLE